MKNLLLALSSTVLFFSCGAPGDPELTCDAAPATATLSTNVQAVIEAKCSKACHLAGDTYGDYTTAAKTGEVVNKLSLYAGTNKTMKVVDPKNLANSSLWLKVLGGAGKGRTGPNGENVFGAMPNDGTSLSADQKKILKDWICSGAK